MKVAFCDDSIDSLQTMIKQYTSYCGKVNIPCEYDAYQSGTELLNNMENRYSVIFLDINMPGIDGISVARELRKSDNDIYIVFITSFIQYALDGYEVDAFRYLLKDQINLSFNGCMDIMLEKMRSRKSRAFFKFIEGEASILLNELMYVESDKHKLLFHIDGITVPYSLYMKLDDVEKQIDSMSFLRLHKSYLVNMEFIEMISRYNATIRNSIILPIPKSKYSEVSSAYLLYRG